MKVLGLIVARSGSKGVVGKNMKLLAGKPLLEYTIDSALEAKELTDVVLSTDSQAYAEFALSKGVSVPFIRPSELAQDHTPTIAVISHAFQTFEGMQMHFDAICLLQPTHPFRKKGSIDVAIEKFGHSGADSLISVLPVPHEFNPHWVFEANSNGYLNLATGEKEIIKRRQDLPAAYFRDGSIYITKTSVLLQSKSLYGEKITYIESDPEYYVNIDREDDWMMAEMKVKTLNLQD
jgi:CMP-N,N'-diacetyllegionaminic acid synthase